MKPALRLTAGILVLVVLAVGAYLWATGMIDSLYAFRSPIKDTPPTPGQAMGTPVTRRVVMVLVDALRYDTSQDAQVMPTLAHLREIGASAKMHSRSLSYSEPGYSTLLTGAWPEVNDGPALNLDYAEIPTWTQDNLFSSASRAGLKTAVSGYYWFEKLIPQEAVTARFYTPGEDAAADRAVMEAALPWLDRPQDYQLVLIHLDQVDFAGHHLGGPRGPEWTASARRSDSQLAEIAAKLDLSQDTLVVFSDHGQVNLGGHGGYEPVTLLEPFVIAGAGVEPGHYADIQMVDVAPTLSALLGLNLPAAGQGQVRTQMLRLPPEELTALPAQTAAQQRKMVFAYTSAIDQPVASPRQADSVDAWQAALETSRVQRLAFERLQRALVALPVLAGLLWLAYRSRGRHTLWIIAGAVTYLLVFNLRYGIVDGLSYSFSSVKGAADLILYCGSTTALALIAGWLVFAWGARLLKETPGEAAQAALGLVYGILWVLALVALVHFVLNGFSATWTLPEPVSFFLGLLALVQGLFVALVGMALVGLSALGARVARLSGRYEALRSVKPIK